MNLFVHLATSLVLVLVLLSPTTRALSFSLTQTNQCGNPIISWSDAQGSSDLTLLVIPTKHGDHNVVQTFTIPSTAKSPLTIDRPFLLPAGSGFMATMWDEAGLSGTSTTGIMTTSPGTSSSCLIPPSNPYVDFFFDFSTFTPTQCSPLSITWESNYTAPLRALALSPGSSTTGSAGAGTVSGTNGGRIWELYGTDSQGTSGFDWKVDLKAGEAFAVVILDQGPLGNGGSSELITVGASSDTSCLVETQSRTKTVVNTESESGKTVLQTIIQVVTQSASTESASASVGKKSSVPIGALVGGIIGGLLILALVVLFLLWRHRRKQVRDPDHPRQSTWKPYRDTTVFLGGIAPYSRGDARGTVTGTGRSSPDPGQPFLASPGEETTLGKLTPGGHSLVESDYGFLPATRETEQPSMGFEQDEELSPYLMPREELGSSSPAATHQTRRDYGSPAAPMMRSLGHGSRGSPTLSTTSANVGEKQGRLGVRNPDTLEEEDTYETISSEMASTVSPLPSRLAGEPLPSSPVRGGPSSKASRHSTYLRQERPATIVQHFDAGIVEQAEGQAAGPDDIIHLPPSYQEASHTPPTLAHLSPN